METKKGTVYFFTGLAGAGKSTIGGLFYERLKAKKPNVVLSDGDKTRAVNQYRDYTYEGRLKGAWGVFENCKAEADKGNDVVCCSICMYTAVREWNRKNIENYKEIYVKVSMETLYTRDQKGLYSSGTPNVVGVDIPAEEPEYPDIVICNEGDETPEQIVDRLEKFFELTDDGKEKAE